MSQSVQVQKKDVLTEERVKREREFAQLLEESKVEEQKLEEKIIVDSEIRKSIKK